jgi:hypothetical protein
LIQRFYDPQNGGEIKFDDEDEVVAIDNASLEATLLLTRQSAIQPPTTPFSGAAVPVINVPDMSTDKAIGLEK